MRKFLVASCLLLVMSLAQADSLDHNRALEMRQKGEILPAQELLSQALAKYPNAHLMEMKLTNKHNQYLYKLEFMTNDGKVRKLYFDAQSGELLREKERNFKRSNR